MPAKADKAAERSLVRVRRALISVSDKTALVEIGQALVKLEIEIISTGNSARTMREAGLAVIEVADYTGFPEMMDGRVKTLHPKIHGAILGRRDLEEHRRQMAAHGIEPIDLVISNLYPFEATVAAGEGFDACIEQIDIGGPALIRSAAKNHAFVAVVTEPQDYPSLLDELSKRDGSTTLAYRRWLAGRAYAHTAGYDAAIAGFMARSGKDSFSERLTLTWRRRQILRYGENPHQEAALYVGGESRPGVANARQVQGKELSYNNLNDTDAAFELVAEFERPAVAIIKHANPCGVAVADSLAEAYKRALAADPVSAYGGVIAVNRPLDEATANLVAKLFAEVVIAPEADQAALAALAGKNQLRLLLTGSMPDPAGKGVTLRSIAGGVLVQTRDAARALKDEVAVVTKRAPSAAELDDLLFAFTVAKHVKSNAIVMAKGGVTVGIGAGQMSRVDSSRLAAEKAGEMAKAAGEEKSRAQGAVAASDAFFPFADGLLALADAGIGAVIQPGGSKRDDEVIKAAEECGLAMVFTGRRHFRH
ncbi:MAG: bifunctional phosphoribosylaminoimidazolecarboxamide formyltransferase/IMP cyclohydrolase [Proteobacteria bacterium]|nr:bifunctional phosphoribosylaminoimidazolecarboxamide formyltransferase/IMP cyclohydrolase [Pseudomonadota bacterium]MBI3498292.1 bifunctional phosphoribosylaminoimidazolecarboxamide formyltransferase/IMP cyclohydrolase [Pseudomonadota bacterium]